MPTKLIVAATTGNMAVFLAATWAANALNLPWWVPIPVPGLFLLVVDWLMDWSRGTFRTTKAITEFGALVLFLILLAATLTVAPGLALNNSVAIGVMLLSVALLGWALLHRRDITRPAG